jgi:muramoyltetrapeptide carboxypeptidase
MPAVAGGILYVEEIAEEPYAVERMLLQLFHAGILQQQRAVLLGDFRDCVPTNTARYPYCMDEAIGTLRAILPCPVLAGLPIGHVARKLTLPFGVEAELQLHASGWTLRWPGLGR